LTERYEVVDAYHEAKNEGSGVMVERFIPGIEHRVLVVGGKVVAATCGRPVSVIGDGKHNVLELIALQVNSDPRRGDTETQPLSPIGVSPGLLLMLRQQKLQLESIPEGGCEVIIKRHDNLSEDVTDRVHPEVAHRVGLAARTIGLDIAGVDLVLEDIARPIEEQRGAVVEVNAGPGLLMHLMPSVGQPRPVGEHIINHIFGPGEDARIPIVCVAGSHGKTTVTRMLHHILKQRYSGAALADSFGIKVGDWEVARAPSDNAQSARDILANPDVNAAVFEASIEGILREGLGFDKCDIAIVTNLTQVDLGGEFDLWSEERIFAVLRTPVDVVLERGAAVLNAADPQVMQMKTLCKGDVILFAVDAGLDSIVHQLAEGKRAVVVAENSIWLCSGERRESLLALDSVNLQSTYQLENMLPAIAAAWHLNISADQIAAAVRS
jgi:cyanophycin synthetase